MSTSGCLQTLLSPYRTCPTITKGLQKLELDCEPRLLFGFQSLLKGSLCNDIYTQHTGLSMQNWNSCAWPMPSGQSHTRTSFISGRIVSGSHTFSCNVAPLLAKAINGTNQMSKGWNQIGYNEKQLFCKEIILKQRPGWQVAHPYGPTIIPP